MGGWLHDLAAFVVNVDLLAEYGWRIVAGVKITAQVVLISCSLGFLLAFPICRARISRNIILSNLAFGYITFFRGTPLLCQLYLVYYGGGEFRAAFTQAGLWWFFRDAYYCCILAFTLNTAAYQAEILRGAIATVPKGQIEAARALGLSPYELISIIKASALAAIVTLMDLMGQTRFIFARTFDFSIYLYCALIYLALTELIRRTVNRIEHGLSRHRRDVAPDVVATAMTAPPQPV